MISHAPTIGFLGIGRMGAPMARNLSRVGFRLTVWNRSIVEAEGLIPFDAQAAASPDRAVHDADIVIIMLENGSIVEEVLFHRAGRGRSIRQTGQSDHCWRYDRRCGRSIAACPTGRRRSDKGA